MAVMSEFRAFFSLKKYPWISILFIFTAIAVCCVLKWMEKSAHILLRIKSFSDLLFLLLLFFGLTCIFLSLGFNSNDGDKASRDMNTVNIINSILSWIKLFLLFGFFVCVCVTNEIIWQAKFSYRTKNISTFLLTCQVLQ